MIDWHKIEARLEALRVLAQGVLSAEAFMAEEVAERYREDFPVLWGTTKAFINGSLRPKGTTVPQTVDDLQEIMEADAKKMLDMASEIAKLKHKINQLEQKRKA